MAFLEKIGEVAKNMTEKASDSIEINKLTGDISIEKGNIQCYHRELGEYYWAKFVTGEQLDPEAMAICDKVVVSQDHIRAMEKQIDQVKADREEIQTERAEAKRIAKEEEARKAEERQRAAEEADATAAEASAIVAQGDEAQPLDTETNFCENCGGVVKASETACPFCGKAL